MRPTQCRAGLRPPVATGMANVLRCHKFGTTAQMPGNDTVIKQNVLGTVAGIALLIFALAYRFLPSFGGGPNVSHEPAPQEPIGAPMSVQAPPQPVTPVAP